jgi:hypothetical protein
MYVCDSITRNVRLLHLMLTSLYVSSPNTIYEFVAQTLIQTSYLDLIETITQQQKELTAIMAQLDDQCYL